MKKLLSILLLLLLVFNMTGFSIYSLLQSGCEEKSSDFDKNLTIKVPFSLPYSTDWQSSGGAESELLHNDNYYNVISQKLTNDTLFIECQFDESARDRFWELVSSFDDHLKASQDAKNQTGHFIKSLLKEYMSFDRHLYFYIFEWIVANVEPHCDTFLLSQNVKRIPSPPPNLI